jgi:type IV pilus assembly protein PilW
VDSSPTCGGNWTDANLTPENANRIKAIRVAIVVRSALQERPPTPGGTCDATTVAPVSWEGGPTIDLSSDPNWQCYRYKVYQSIIPMINVIWASV